MKKSLLLLIGCFVCGFTAESAAMDIPSSENSWASVPPPPPPPPPAFAGVNGTDSLSIPLPPPPPTSAVQSQTNQPKLSYKERQAKKLNDAKNTAENNFKSLRDSLINGNFREIDCIENNLKDTCKVSVEFIELKKDKDLSCIKEIIEAEKTSTKLTNADIATFFDFDNTITRTNSLKEKNVFLSEHKELLNWLSGEKIDWCIITASRAEGPQAKHQVMIANGINLERNVQEQYAFLPTLLTHKGSETDASPLYYGIDHNGRTYDFATIEYISCGKHVLLAGIPMKNNELVDGAYIYNDINLLTGYGKLGYASDGYQKPAAMRYFLKDKSPKKLIIVADDNPRNVLDFINDFEAKLTGNVADSVKLIAIWYQPTDCQHKEHMEFEADLHKKFPDSSK